MSPLSSLFHRRLHKISFHLHRYISTTSSPLKLDLSHPIYMIWGSNTGVGKTLVSTGLAASVLMNKSAEFNYIKPVQTGFPADSDSRFVYRKILEVFGNRDNSNLIASNHSLKASNSAAKDVFGSEIEGFDDGGMRDLCWYEEKRVIGSNIEEGLGSKLVCKTLYGWSEAISPHLAAEREKAAVEDEMLLEKLKKCLRAGVGDEGSNGKDVWTAIETAGGVASPGPSGTLQCDLYRPFRLPVVLVGDGRLGGISGTISAYESLKLRGYDIAAVIFEDNGLMNEMPLMTYLRNRVPVLVLPSVPQDQSNNLIEWFEESQDVFDNLKETMLLSHQQRVSRLHEMPKKAKDIFWWPFTQHDLVPEESVTVIDSRLGENFSVHKARTCEYITEQFDACASWWTQGPDATLQIELARDMGYATARFGHVMFPENVYEPALRCAELLLEGVGRGWASRTFFSDNGSTAIEVALKMAFRKFSFDHGVLSDFRKGRTTKKPVEFKVLALNGSYHGDTLGAMEAQAPSPYTGFLQQPWYRGRGLFLDPPTIFISNRCWNLSLPKVLKSEKFKSKHQSFSSRNEYFSASRENSELARSYSAYISHELLSFSESADNDNIHIGALIIEPVIQGAGGMHMVDPLFQRVLVKECRNRKIPVIFDEVFTGFWRLGVESAAELLGCQPDIACYAKLMTGGVIPLSATLATESVFESFKSDSKLMALLHGHSYSAHAMGCSAAAKAIQWFKDPSRNLNITAQGTKLRELWDEKLVYELSSHQAVERVVALGTIVAIELCTPLGSDAGYGSVHASSLVRKLREDGVYMRPLGNVLYLMCGPCTNPKVCDGILKKVYKEIDEFSPVMEKLESCEL
ncbi:Bifunctional dethiobiotin synthetase/7 [Ranunculus cassubicifolius]